MPVILQMNVVGKAQTSYLPGVLVPEINAGGVAEQAGFQPGDIILRVGDYTVAANPRQVSSSGGGLVDSSGGG
jgi:S1-C subfamily serine protease